MLGSLQSPVGNLFAGKGVKATSPIRKMNVFNEKQHIKILNKLPCFLIATLGPLELTEESAEHQSQKASRVGDTGAKMGRPENLHTISSK